MHAWKSLFTGGHGRVLHMRKHTVHVLLRSFGHEQSAG